MSTQSFPVPTDGTQTDWTATINPDYIGMNLTDCTANIPSTNEVVATVITSSLDGDQLSVTVVNTYFDPSIPVRHFPRGNMWIVATFE